MSLAPSAKGTVRFGDYKTWYRVTGDPSSGKPVLVVVHGGPGSTHDYLLRMSELAARGWPVMHYDQLGNGGSTHLPDKGPDFWTPELFEAELTNLVRQLGIDGNYVPFGQSWGGLLVAMHAAKRPKGLKGLVIANSPASYPLWLQEMKVLRDQLPPGVDEILRRHEAEGTTDSPEYYSTMQAFYDKHVCRIKPAPRDMQASQYEIYNDPTVYFTMNGPSEFFVVGTLKNWNVIPLLGKINAPTLVTSGKYDEATPVIAETVHKGIPDSEWVLFENSSHMAHVEEADRYLQVLSAFISRHEP